MAWTMPEEDASYTVGQIAATSGVASSAIRFYEEHRLISSHRTSGNQRRFSQDASCRVKIIRVCQRVGLTVAEIRELLSVLPEDGPPAVSDWDLLGARLEADVRRRINELQRALADFTSGDFLCEVSPVDHGALRAAEAGADSSSVRS